MKKRTFILSFLFTLIFAFFSFSPDIIGQTHCCCVECTSPTEQCIPLGGEANCPTACFLLSAGCNPGPSENSNDPACADTPSCGVAPVGLISFKLSSSDQGIEVEWKTESEENNEGFMIQRMSGIDLNWEGLAFVSGYGTTIVPQQYIYLDRMAPPGINYYRLKQIDFDGTFAYSEVESVNIDEKEEYILWPTLAKDYVLLKTKNFNSGTKHRVEVFDLMGRKVIQTDFDNGTSIDISNLEKGQYIVNVYHQGKVETMRFVKVQ